MGRRIKRQSLLLDHPVENQSLCRGCDGECCRSFPALEITWQEYEILKAHGATRLYFSLIGRHKLIVENGCEFLSQGQCSIYNDRPSVCQRFICLKKPSGPVDGQIHQPDRFNYDNLVKSQKPTFYDAGEGSPSPAT